MNEFLSILEFLTKYVSALEIGVDKFIKMTPVLTRQNIETQARRKLQSSREQYLEALKVNLNKYVLVVELDDENWLANAVETGVPGWDMKKTHLNKNFKVSAQGYRYKVIPMKKEKGYEPGTEKGKTYQEAVEKALKNLNKSKLGPMKVQSMPGGKIKETQKIISDSPLSSGLYRTRVFESKEAFHNKRGAPAWQYVMFRVMSDNPKQKDKWLHPGIEPVHILRETERWMENNFETILEGFIQEALKEAEII